ncbi:RNA polymerase sigma factor [Microbacterium sp. SS28]|uniref:RNA polymerase sigma factor n=1 Tax=Microbacterium sp. SS28 TaxID=2919948 RepID=UPI001FA95632|nr:RNA polymerase sigma factor [Microbacterium sp. SS28]
MTTVEVTDAERWRSALQGNGDALGELFDLHHSRVYRHSLRLVPNPVDAEDVAAVVWLEAWRHRDRIRFVDGSMLPWLLVVATNASLNLTRSARRHRALLRRLPPPAPQPDHADALDAGPAQAALAQLSRPHREVVALCVLNGLSEAQAAQALGVPPGTVKSRLSRANRALRVKYQELASQSSAGGVTP